MFWNLMRLWEISVEEVREKGDKSVCERVKKNTIKMRVVYCVFNVSKKEKKKNMDMTHEKNWKGKGVRRKNKIQKKRMCMLWKK